MTARAERWLEATRPETPCLVVDLDRVVDNYRALEAAVPDARIFYAVKANPAPELLGRLVDLGAHFDVASVAEIDDALAAGAPVERLSYGNTIKKERDIAAAYGRGVGLFAFDAGEELEKIARAAPGARVFCRILADNGGAEWPLNAKFGCTAEMATDLLRRAPALGLVPWGLAFHVGSQQKDPQQWDAALAATAAVFRALEADGIELAMVNLGGGFATRYREDVPSPAEYGEAIHEALAVHFGNRLPEIVVEPGRGLVGDAGVLETEVVLVSHKGEADPRLWVYLDIGKFGGLAETMDEAIRYPIASDRPGPTVPVVIAGPTCDSADVLYERTPYQLPHDLEAGDRLRIKSTGAYTTTYASVGFNGFAPLRQICI
jgi:ornithine decarboxylase